jgi:hypothetical protein
MKKPYSSPILRVISPLHTIPSTRDDSREHHGVAIRYYAPCACEAVQRIDTKPFLSTKPPLFLETKRFSPNEAPSLPLPGCTASRCICCYAHYEDRREQDRRLALPKDIDSAPFFVGLERRSGINRRQPRAIDQLSARFGLHLAPLAPPAQPQG